MERMVAEMKKRGLLLIFTVLLLGGCATERAGANLSGIHFVASRSDTSARSDYERACTIKERLAQLEGLIDAAVVVEGGTAITQKLKEAADMAARAADRLITNTSITARPSIVVMIERLEEQETE